MKPNYSKLMVEGELPTKGRRMQVAEDGMAYILRMLIDMYSDKELAVLRELSTNAIDSHIMAGNSDPIQVSTPSALSPYLMIKDEGLGMSVDEIYELFGSYGASTKRGTNDATGMLGIGSKSPLTYTDQFTMTSIKNGVRAIVAITREADGVGQINVVDTAMTNYPDGVEIKIPAKTGNAFEAKAKRFFQYWKTGTVLLNGKDPSGLSDVMEITPNIFLAKKGPDPYSAHLTDYSVIVMGNVPYPAPALSASAIGVPSRHALIAYVPIGAVEFAPSREALLLPQDSKLTRDTIESIKTDFRKGLQGAVQREVDKAKTAQEALQVMESWISLYPYHSLPTFTHKGKNLPWSLTVPTVDRFAAPAQRIVMSQQRSTGSRARSSFDNIGLGELLQSIFVTGFDQNEATLTLRKKVQQWQTKQSAAVQHLQKVVWLDWKPELLDFIDPERIVSIADVRAEKLPKKAPAAVGSRIPGSFNIVLGGKANFTSGYSYAPSEHGVPGDQINQNYPVFYLHGNAQTGRRHTKILNHTYDNYTLICLPENRLEKFRRENPKISSVPDEIQRLAKQAEKNITLKERRALSLHDAAQRSFFFGLYGFKDKIDDPAIKEAIDLSQVKIDHLIAVEKQFQGYMKFSRDPWENPMTKYLLVARAGSLYGWKDQAHTLRYINNEYAFQTGRKNP